MDHQAGLQCCHAVVDRTVHHPNPDRSVRRPSGLPTHCASDPSGRRASVHPGHPTRRAHLHSIHSRLPTVPLQEGHGEAGHALPTA